MTMNEALSMMVRIIQMLGCDIVHILVLLQMNWKPISALFTKVLKVY